MKNALIILVVFLISIACSSDSAKDIGPNNSGKGGSLAKFTIVGNNLYTVNENKLISFKIDTDETLTKKSSQTIDAFAETIFPFKNHLLLGTRTGMFVYSLLNADSPLYSSRYTHMASCDPVVAQGDFAYVTLRNGSPCQRGNNQLDVINISNLQSPVFVKTERLQNPFGLGTKDNLLLVCEKDFGLTLFDITSPGNPIKLKTISDIKAFDVIPSNDRFIFSGETGIEQYKVSQKAEFQFLSKISIND